MSTECCRGNVCVEHRCVESCPRSYDVEVTSGYVYARAEGGYYWDHEYPDEQELDRNPDPYVVLTIGDQTLTTRTLTNTTAPAWVERLENVHFDCQGAYYSIQMYDDDSAEDGEDDLILTFGEDGFWYFTDWDMRVGGISIVQGTQEQPFWVRLILSPN